MFVINKDYSWFDLVLSTRMLLISCYLFLSLPGHAQTTLLPELLTSPTPQQLETRQQQLSEAQARNQSYQHSLQVEGLALATKITSLENMTPDVMVKVLEIAAQEREALRTQLENFFLEQQEIKSNSDKLLASLQQQQEQLKQLNQSVSKPETVPDTTDSPKQPIAQLEQNIAWQTKARELEQQYLEAIKQTSELVGKRLRIAIEWHARLQQLHQQLLLDKRQYALQELRTSLEQNHQALLAKQSELSNQIARLETEQVTLEMLAEILATATLEKKAAAVEVENLRLEVQSNEANLARQAQNLQEQQNKLVLLKKTIPEPDRERIQLTIKEIRIWELDNNIKLQTAALKLEQQYLDILKTTRTDLANKRLKLATDWHEQVQALYQKRQKQDLDSHLQQQQQHYLSRSAELREQLAALPETESKTLRYLLEAQITEADEQAQQHDIKFTYLKDQVEQLQKRLTPTTKEISQETLQQAQRLGKEITTLEQLLAAKKDVLEQKQEFIKKQAQDLTKPASEYKNQAEQLLNKLIQTKHHYLEQLMELQRTTETVLYQLEDAYKENQRQLLLRRRTWPTNTAEWQNLFKDISYIPILFLQQLQTTWHSFKQSFQQLNYSTRILIIFVTLIGLSIWLWFYQRLTHFLTSLNHVKEHSFVTNYLLIGLQLLQRNALGIAITSLFLLFILVTQPDQTSILFSLTLAFIWLGIKVPLNLAWLLLSNNDRLSPEQRPKLYWQFHWTFIFTGVLIVLTVLGHLLELSLAVRDLIDTLFMLLLSLTVVPVIYIRNTLLTLLKSILTGYWLWVYRFISILLPLAILAVALLGLIGYLNLGWSIAKQMSLFLLVLTSWLIIEGLLADMITVAKNFALKHSHYGLLWTQDIIPLLHKLLGIALTGLAIVSFFWLNGWYADVVKDITVKESLEKLFAYPVGELGGSEITIANILFSLLAVWAIFWFGSWIRQVTYRWIYLGISDLGIRHSLSILTQYLVVFIGLLITLKAIGFDLTTLMVFAGALGIGIGFGLQNIVNNFISGLLLLIERPLRLGDIVTIGSSCEGKVSQIGIRSLTIQNWNYQEVIVPNSELISHAFTNWTRSTPIIRTTLNIGISYHDDPSLALQIFQEVLQQVPNVLTEPAPAVYLSDFGDSAIMFRLDYYINMTETGFLIVKSNVLLKIWERLKQAGITIPYPQRDVYVKLA